jgi:hypothetical protein
MSRLGTRENIALQTPEIMLRRGRRELPGPWQIRETYCNCQTVQCSELRWPGRLQLLTVTEVFCRVDLPLYAQESHVCACLIPASVAAATAGRISSEKVRLCAWGNKTPATLSMRSPMFCRMTCSRGITVTLLGYSPPGANGGVSFI